MNNNSDTSNQYVLDNGRYIDPDIMDIVHMYVEERIPSISPDKTYTLRQIIGEENWNELSKIAKLDAGYCMVHLVKTGVLPFKFAKGKGDNHRRYQLK